MIKLYKYNPNNIAFEPIKAKVFITIAIVFLFLLITSFFTYKKAINNSSEIIYENTIITQANANLKNSSFSPKKLKEELQKLNIKHIEIVYAQAVLETGNFTSTLFNKNSNLFGMKMAKTRPTTAIKQELNHAYYNNWEESVIDYAFWQTTFARNLTEEEYLKLLNECYAADPNYIVKLKRIMKK